MYRIAAVGLFLALFVVGCSSPVSSAEAPQAPAGNTQAPAGNNPAPVQGPQPPFTKAQAAACHADVDAIYAPFSMPGDMSDRQNDAHYVQLWLDTLNGVKTSGSGLLEPQLSVDIAKVSALLAAMQSPMTPDALQSAMSQIDQIHTDLSVNRIASTNPTCTMIDDWISANVAQ
jgi:hypothetical protein